MPSHPRVCEHCDKQLDAITGRPIMDEATAAWIQHMEDHPWDPPVHIVKDKKGDGKTLVMDKEILYTRIARIRWERGTRIKRRGWRFNIGRLAFSLAPIPKDRWEKRARRPRRR